MSATDLIGTEFTYAVAGRFPDGVPGIVLDVQHLGVIENSVTRERHRAVRFLLRLRDGRRIWTVTYPDPDWPIT